MTRKNDEEYNTSVEVLRQLFPEYSWPYVVAPLVGAIHPPKRARLRQSVIHDFAQNAGMTVRQAALNLGLNCEQVRRVVNALHRDGLVHIVGFRRLAALYALGPGQDMTREAWAMQAHHGTKVTHCKPADTAPPPDWPTVRFSLADGQPCEVSCDPLMAAFYGLPTHDRK